MPCGAAKKNWLVQAADLAEPEENQPLQTRETVRSRRPQHLATGSIPLTELQNRLGQRLRRFALGEMAGARQ